MKKAVIVLSGGQDSTTCLYAAKARGFELHAVSFFYGQRHRKELEVAQKVAQLAGATWRQFSLEVLGELADSALVSTDQALTGGGGRADVEAPGGLPSSFVPGRNALFLAVAAAYAVKVGAHDVFTGVCQTDYSGYPDCREVFVKALESAVSLAMPTSCLPLNIHTPLMHLSKAESVRLARSLPGCWDALAHTITCYEGQRPGCGVCPACVLRAQGFTEAGEVDPAQAMPAL